MKNDNIIYQSYSEQIPDEDFLFEDAYWADDGSPVIPCMSDKEEEMRLVPDFFRDDFPKYNVLNTVGLKPLGYYQVSEEMADCDGDFSFLDNVTIMRGDYGLVETFRIPMEVDDIATINMIELLVNHSVGPFVSVHPEGDDAVCFQVCYSQRIQSFLWFRKQIFLVESTESFRAKVKDNHLIILTTVAKDFSFSNAYGFTFSLVEWVPFSLAVLDQANNGLSFFFEDKRYTVFRDYYFRLRVQSGIAYTSDMVPVMTTELMENGYYDLTFEKFVATKSCKSNLFVGISSRGERIFTRGRYRSSEGVVSFSTFSRLTSSMFSYLDLYNLSFKEIKQERHPDNECIAFTSIKSKSFQETYYNSGRSFVNYLREASYVEIKNRMSGSRIKNGHGYSKERPIDVTTPTVYLLTFAIKKKLFKFFSHNKDTGDVLLVSERFSVSWFYSHIVNQGMYWHNGRYFDLNFRRKLRNLGVADCVRRLYVYDEFAKTEFLAPVSYRRFPLVCVPWTILEIRRQEIYLNILLQPSHDVRLRVKFRIEQDVFGRFTLPCDSFLCMEVDNIRGGVNKKRIKALEDNKEEFCKEIPFRD